MLLVQIVKTNNWHYEQTKNGIGVKKIGPDYHGESFSEVFQAHNAQRNGEIAN